MTFIERFRETESNRYCTSRDIEICTLINRDKGTATGPQKHTSGTRWKERLDGSPYIFGGMESHFGGPAAVR